MMSPLASQGSGRISSYGRPDNYSQKKVKMAEIIQCRVPECPAGRWVGNLRIPRKMQTQTSRDCFKVLRGGANSLAKEEI